MDGTLEMDTVASVVCPEAGSEYAKDFAEMDRILELLAAELNRRLGAQQAATRNLSSLDEKRLLLEEHRSTLIACCRLLRERRSADPEMVFGLELMLGDLSHDQLGVFLASLPTLQTARQRRVTR